MDQAVRLKIVQFLDREIVARQIGFGTVADPLALRTTIPDRAKPPEPEQPNWGPISSGSYVNEYLAIRYAFSAFLRGEEQAPDSVRFILDQFALWCLGEVREPAVAIYAVMHPANRAIPRDKLALLLFEWAMDLGPLQV